MEQQKYDFIEKDNNQSSVDENPALIVTEHIKIIDVETGNILLNSRC